MTTPSQIIAYYQRSNTQSPLTKTQYASASFRTAVESEDAQWLSAQQTEATPAKDFPETLICAPKSAGSVDELKKATTLGTDGSVGSSARSFIYLDVGAWFGADTDPTSVLGGERTLWKKARRDFGIIAGPHVLLCSYRLTTNTDLPQADDAGWVEASKSTTDIGVQSILALLTQLVIPSDPSEHPNPSLPDERRDHPTLRQIVVVRYLYDAAGKNVDGSIDSHVHILFGDMHLPFVDAGNYDAMMGARTRWGRVNVRNLERLVQYLGITPTSTGALGNIVTLLRDAVEDYRGVKQAYTPQLSAEQNGLVYSETVKVLVSATSGRGDLQARITTGWSAYDAIMDEKSNTIDASESARWFAHYARGFRQGDPMCCNEGKLADGDYPPADISEDSGYDFAEVVYRVVNYSSKDVAGAQAEGECSLWDVKLHQLGDMVDLWIGLCCYWQKSSHPYLPVSVTDRGVVFANQWLAGFLTTKQGMAITTAVGKLGVRGHYLYGNHDNYLGASKLLRVPLTSGATDGVASTEFLGGRSGTYCIPKYIWMEHGHQCDGANANELPTLPVGGVVGRDATLGSFLTQAAFVRPEPIRLFEAPVGAFKNALLDCAYGLRPWQVLAACRLFCQHGFRMYAMGHTHTACLTRVCLEDYDTYYYESKKVGVDSRARVDLLRMGAPGTGRLQIAWTNVPLEHVISLEEPEAPANRRAIAHHGELGSATDGEYSLTVLPGGYEARVYSKWGELVFKSASRHIETGVCFDAATRDEVASTQCLAGFVAGRTPYAVRTSSKIRYALSEHRWDTVTRIRIVYFDEAAARSANPSLNVATYPTSPTSVAEFEQILRMVRGDEETRIDGGEFEIRSDGKPLGTQVSGVTPTAVALTANRKWGVLGSASVLAKAEGGGTTEKDVVFGYGYVYGTYTNPVGGILKL